MRVRIDQLRHAEYNPRRITPEDFGQIKKSIMEFGLVQPIVVNRAAGREGIIIGGNQRYEAIKQMGYEEIDVFYVDIPNLAREKELNIRMNKNQADWDWDILQQYFGASDLTNWGFSPMEITIFDDKKKFKEETEPTPEPPENPASKNGFLYLLGEHHLLCGDCTDKEIVLALMGTDKARLIFTDPPYSVNYQSLAGNSYSKGKYGDDKIFNDNKNEMEALEFYKKILTNLYEFSTEDVSLYWWFANGKNWINRLAWMETGWHMAQILIWLKEQMIFSIGQDYHRCYEPCMYGWKKGNNHFTNKRISNAVDCIYLDKESFADLPDVWFERRDKTNEYVHPTQKPVKLCHRALRGNSIEGDIVLDFFGGSGSTLIACEQFKRKARLMELDPKYCDVIIRRWCNFTGKNESEVYANALCVGREDETTPRKEGLAVPAEQSSV